MKTITIDLNYDTVGQLHHLPLDVLASFSEDFHLRLRPPKSGIVELSGMVAIRNVITLQDINRLTDCAISGLETGKGVIALMMPETSYEIHWDHFYSDTAGASTWVNEFPITNSPERRYIKFSTGGTLPVGFPATRLEVTLRCILLPSCTLPRLMRACTDKGINIQDIHVLEPIA
jgi:hypothetical protein